MISGGAESGWPISFRQTILLSVPVLEVAPKKTPSRLSISKTKQVLRSPMAANIGAAGATAIPQSQQQQQRPRQQPQPPNSTPGQRFAQPGLSQHRNANRLGDYRIVKTLGEGSFGKVRRKYSLRVLNRIKFTADSGV